MTGTGNLYIISAPSGTGKTTLVKTLLDTVGHITVSISHTTRLKRPGEMDGVNYYFIDEAAFQKMIKNKEFLEYATIFDHHYGTSRRWVEYTLTRGLDVILEIDWQGHQQIKKLFPEAIGIFILPPTLEDLRQRLAKREQGRPNIVAQRLADVHETIAHVDEYEYVVINDDFNHALADLKTIIEAGRLLGSRQTKKYAKLLHELSELN